MSDFDIRNYQPTDELYLWWLGHPAKPLFVGTLSNVRSRKGVSLQYSQSWLRSGFALSEDLPLREGLYLPIEMETAAGAVDDARPDRWGERVIRFLDKPARLAVMDYLFFAGDERFGALGVSVSQESYVCRQLGPLPQLSDINAIAHLIQQVLNGEPIEESQKRLIAPGGTLGGARPKALIYIDGNSWVVKFNEPGESIDMPLVEHATMTLAAKAGIRVAQTRSIALQSGHAVAVKRFDREDDRRRHALSAQVVLKAAGEAMGYPELAQVLRRRGVVEGGLGQQHMAELFRRMVFNILMDNTDDHEKNHVVLVNDRNEYELSPAFDVLPSGQALGYQQMRVGIDQADSNLENAMSEHPYFGLNRSQAREQVKLVVNVVGGWREHFAAYGVIPTDVEALGQQIDRAYLYDQRQKWT